MPNPELIEADADFKRISERLIYDPMTGNFIWKRRDISTPRWRKWNDRYAGKPAGNILRGYLRICIGNRSYFAHRIAWLLERGHWPVGEIDHINGIKSDNKLLNLREATRHDNNQNIHAPQKNSSTKIRGVYFHKMSGRYEAKIQVNGRQIFLGLFDDVSSAESAYKAAKYNMHSIPAEIEK